MGPSPAIAVGAAALLDFGFSFPWSPVAAIVLRQTPESQPGSAVSVLGAVYDLFVGIGSFAAGAVANRLGYPAAFMMAAAALGAAAITGQFVFPPEPARAQDAEEILDAAGDPEWILRANLTTDLP